MLNQLKWVELCQMFKLLFFIWLNFEFQVAAAAIEHCLNEGNSKKSEFDEMTKLPAAPGEKMCNMMSGFLLGCVHAQVFKNCPKDKSGADAECDKIKAFADKCGFLMPMKPKA